MSLFRHTLFTSLASAVIGGVSAIYALLIARFYSDQPLSTDAFFLAYSIYMLATTFSVTLRVSVAPVMIGGTNKDPRDNYGKIALLIILLFTGIALTIAALSYPIGQLLARGLSSEGRYLTSWMLLAFAPVIFLLGMSFFFSAVLGALRQFEYAAIAMIISSLAGLALFAATHQIGIFSIILGFFLFNLLLVLVQWRRAHRFGLFLPLTTANFARSFSHFKALIPLLRPSVVYVAVHFLYIISQSMCSWQSPGTPTVLAYAYMLIAMAISVTAGSMGIALAPDFGEYAGRGREAFVQFVVAQMKKANRIACGAIVLLAILAYPLGLFIFAVLPAEAAESASWRPQLFARLIWSLAPGAWGLSLFSVLAPAVIAAGHQRYFGRFAFGAIALHLLLSLLLGSWLGPVGLGIGISLSLILFGFFFAAKLARYSGGREMCKLLIQWSLWPFLAAILAAPAAYLIARLFRNY